MADFKRKAHAIWYGDLHSGNGKMTASSGIFKDVPYAWNTRFANERGTNPEELLAAAHASCYSMAFASYLSKKGHKVESIRTNATCFLSPKPTGGFRISKMLLQVSGKVAGIDQATFATLAKEAEATECPVSNLLHPGLTVELEATLAK